MAVKRRGEKWRRVIGKRQDNKIDKVQREQLNARYRKWFLLLEDESILPHYLDRRADRAHELAADQAITEIESQGRMTDLIADYLKRHASTLKTFSQIQRMWGQGELDWDDPSVSEPHNPGLGAGRY